MSLYNIIHTKQPGPSSSSHSSTYNIFNSFKSSRYQNSRFKDL